MSFNYYPDVDKYFKTLYSLNREWFETRSMMEEVDLKTIFQLFLKLENQLMEIKKILNKKALKKRMQVGE